MNSKQLHHQTHPASFFSLAERLKTAEDAAREKNQKRAAKLAARQAANESAEKKRLEEARIAAADTAVEDAVRSVPGTRKVPGIKTTELRDYAERHDGVKAVGNRSARATFEGPVADYVAWVDATRKRQELENRVMAPRDILRCEPGMYSLPFTDDKGRFHGKLVVMIDTQRKLWVKRATGAYKEVEWCIEHMYLPVSHLTSGRFEVKGQISKKKLEMGRRLVNYLMVLTRHHGAELPVEVNNGKEHEEAAAA